MHTCGENLRDCSRRWSGIRTAAEAALCLTHAGIYAIGGAMADEIKNDPPVTLEYESPGPVWRSGDYLECAIILISFLLIAWIAFGFILSLVAGAFNVQMSERMMLVAIFASGALAVIATIIAYWGVMRLRR